MKFGRAARSLWALSSDATYLNHGSFGACPLAVLEEQSRLRGEMERSPDRFIIDRIIPKKDQSTALREAARRVAAFTGVSGDTIALVESSTVGTQAVLQSVDLKPGDAILTTDQGYNAVRLAVETRCKETGARPLVVNIPLYSGPQEIRRHIRAAASRNVKLAIIDHITSPTAWVLPVREIVADLRELGILVHVDGAHAVGQLPLDIADIDPDWYVSNAHKWLYAPKGSAFLYASANVAAFTRPAIVSHFIEMGFPRSFDYVGTRDYTGWLCIPRAIEFLGELGAEDFRRHNAAIIRRASELLERIGARPAGPIEPSAAMRTFTLPQRRELREDDGAALRAMVWNEERIEVHAFSQFGALLLRICAQAYVDESDVETLANALEKRGWPGR